ncbi:MAG: ankyrin repeat domain-containing protein [Fimbriimonadaceae bacterium]|nr:ankyrin repeat domain-containing protein [Fimbriimonadaceae bacterium]
MSNKFMGASRLVSSGVLAAGLAMITIGLGHSQERSGRSSTEPPVAARGKFGQDLFFAVDRRDVAEVESLLKKGADPNSRNGLELSPLHIASASFQPEVMQALIAAGAKPDLDTIYGTPLAFAAMSGNMPGAGILLSHGAKVNSVRQDGYTVLMMAANSGSPELVAELIKRKADINAKSASGSTALIYTARSGHMDAAKELLEAGASIEAADEEGQTALMTAAMSGHADYVKMLLQRGAKPNVRNAKGQTALILAAAYGDNPEVTKALLDAGADASVSDKQGRTAAAFASVRGNKGNIDLLGKPSSAALVAMKHPQSVKQAATLSVIALQSSMTDFTRRALCVSCHHEGLGRMVMASAKDRGFKMDENLQKIHSGRVSGMLDAMKPLHEMALKSEEAMKQIPLIEMNEVAPVDSWLLAGMAAQKEPANAASAAMAMVLAKQQSPEGFWAFSLPRVPMQSSVFTLTALSVQSLNFYGPRAHASEMKERIGRAKSWMMSAPAKTADDLAFRLLGLKWCSATLDEKSAAMKELQAAQRSDGGWSQVPGVSSDSYATGLALYALHIGGGMPTTDPVYQRGVQYLLRTQDADGTWFVPKRALPANNYLNAGYPHGESQYSSFNGGCWATMALLQTLPKK